MLVSIRTGMFSPDEPKFAKGVLCELPYLTDDTRYITRAAIAGLEHEYRASFSSGEKGLEDFMLGKTMLLADVRGIGGVERYP